MIMRTICTFVCLVMLIITGISFIFIINPKRTKQIQSSFDLEQPIKDINGQNIQENLNLQKNTIVLFLNSDCDFCKQEIDFIDKNIDIFKSKYNLLIVSFENRDKLKIFENLTKIDNNSPFIIISDPDFDLINKYEITEVPSLFLFTPDGKERLSHRGIALDTLEELLKQTF